MSHGLKLTRINVGSVKTIDDAAKAIIDIVSQFNILAQILGTPEDNPGAGDVKAFVREEDGSHHLYELVAGAGVTITPDTAAKTLTFTSP